jgi:hypothetical protein
MEIDGIFIAVWYNLPPFGKCYGCLVYFVVILGIFPIFPYCTKKQL